MSGYCKPAKPAALFGDTNTASGIPNRSRILSRAKIPRPIPRLSRETLPDPAQPPIAETAAGQRRAAGLEHEKALPGEGPDCKGRNERTAHEDEAPGRPAAFSEFEFQHSGFYEKGEKAAAHCAGGRPGGAPNAHEQIEGRYSGRDCGAPEKEAGT